MRTDHQAAVIVGEAIKRLAVVTTGISLATDYALTLIAEDGE